MMNNNIKKITSIAIPVAFQSLIQSSLSVIDQMMVSRLGGTAMAAAGLALRPLTILFFMFMGLSGALNIFTAQYFGDGKPEEIKAVFKLTLKYGLAILFPIMALAAIAPEWTVRVFSNDLRVVQEGAGYLKIISISFPFMLLTILLSGIMKSCGKVGLPMKAGIVSVISNTLLNIVFIYGFNFMNGKIVFAGWGLAGAAVATVLAKMIECSILAVGVKRTGILSMTKKSEIPVSKKFFKVAYPLLLSEIIFVSSITFYSVLYGHMGTVQMAAMTVLYPLQNIAFGLFAGMSTASAALVGQALGSGDFEGAKKMAKTILLYTLMLGLSLVAAIIIALPEYLKLFSLESRIYKEAHLLILVAMSILPFQILNMVIYEGVLRTGGETGYLIKIQLSTLWSIGVPAGIIFGFILKLPLPVVFYAVSFEEIVRFCISFYMMKREVWIARLTV